MKKLLLSLYAILVIGLSSNAQTADHKWAVGLNFGISEYYGDLGNGFWKFDLSPNNIYGSGGTLSKKNRPGILGVNVATYLTPRFDLNFSALGGEEGFYSSSQYYYYTTFGYVDATFRWKFLAKDNAIITPYFMMGLGSRYTQLYKGNDFGQDFAIDAVIPLGAGANFRCSERIYINVQSYYGWTSGDKVEGKAAYARLSYDQLWHHTVGMSFLLGKLKDEDGDGVGDKRDKCSGTPKGALVDKDGCIVDGDKDGIADNFDACPTIAGLAAFNGCPDTDNDGIEDSKDKCITVAGIAKFEGCPDTDEDGVEDSKDKCPNTAGLFQFNGCPDSDGDGIEDALDKCPRLIGTAAFEGCPDTDGDGISDNFDKCPALAGTTANNGCPEIKQNLKQLFEKALQGVQFETGKSAIKKQSFPILDAVAKAMNENPSYRLFIGGHTDNVGDPAKNLTLSKDRAASVKSYLVSKGVDVNKIESEGFGDTMPVADNATSAGKTKNRRVEFKVQFEDFIK